MTLFTLPEATIAKQGRSIHSSTGYWVTRLARAMECDFENRLNAHGVSRAACAILSAITNDGKTTPASLASFIGIDAAAITRHLDRLEEQGLLVRERSAADRRVVNLKLTRKGSRLVPKLVADSKATNMKFLASLTLAEKKGLQEIMQKMLANSDLVPGDI
ncbi:MarR family winged helix-turn-helix transcriptional regulator [Novipirellula artificiosorum]|uniref:Transcriptional repressor MprA n=1 Tax=Novipirellula artificiosorum TaxID=2528016 RepID=A0A5C6CVV9_9BACT|nr:MarR family transcriptional regulator [Novipirellula artificiosorum]TWU27965.1 Transcriptional repressor MprA [Novipirellula artificiosorum]